MDDQTRQSSGSTITTSDATTTGSMTSENFHTECACPQVGPETIQVEQVLGANMMQRVVETALTVPDPKPDIEQVLDVYVKDLVINSINVIPDKVIVRGDLAVKVLYVAELPNQPVHAYEQSHVRWTRDILVDGAQPGMKATADVVVEYINYDFNPANPRQVFITVVLKIWTRVVTTTDMDVYTLPSYSTAEPFEVSTASASGTLSAGTGPSAPEAGGENVFVTEEVTPAAGTSAGVSGMATVTGNGVNVRTGPGTNFPVVTKVNRGDTVTLKDQAFGWNKVVLSDGNTTGWIAGWLLNTGAE